MDRIQILVIDPNKKMVAMAQELIDQNISWQITIAYNDEEAILFFQQMQYDIVLFGKGINDAYEIKLRNIFLFQQPEVIIMQYDGSNSELLEKEIREALDKRSAEHKAKSNFFKGTFN
jgi:CheY-like chemotaxis protein